jgi:hypothetical protein
MATILLSAAGAAAGSAVGGSLFGVSAAVVGRAVGATVGKIIDQRLLGSGSEAVETGRVERFRLTGASEGRAISQVYGRMRVGGQVIWSTQFSETVVSSGGGKGAPTAPATNTYSYSVSLAIALCEGTITRVGRVWADGVEIARDQLSMRVYSGAQDQLPDPKIEAVEGTGNAPAYRGVAYVVIENLALGAYGNRVPQFSFEVVRPAATETLPAEAQSVSKLINAVAVIPGTGEYALATTPVYYEEGLGENRSANVNSPSGKTDFSTSLEQLGEELPNCGSVSLIVSWFGDDLRCGECTLKPKVEQTAKEGVGMAWRVDGVLRGTAETLPQIDGRAIYGGTPADQSVIEALQASKAAGQRAMFYPFVLMEQLEGNGRADPWSGATDQPELPWRGRITTSIAPGNVGSPDQTLQAQTEVDGFFGTATPEDFLIEGEQVSYIGPEEWSYRRFILHYAHLCAVAGGVDAFCIGSELRGMTQVRGPGSTFPTVDALRLLLADVRQVLGTLTKLSYAADWSEYFGYHPADGSGDVFFHLDPLWADENTDFIGIDNYHPLSDWRDGDGHADAGWNSIYDLGYLKSNIAGGEGFDWYYANDTDRETQMRSDITDGAYNEPWVFRYKDLVSWWEQSHHNRTSGVRVSVASDWVPQSKPIWFTEIGCPAVDKGSNQPNKFIDPKSSESSLPYSSTGARDDLIQAQYLRAISSHWSDIANNPASAVYGQPMVDMDNAHVWAWDARPFPHFPASVDVWSDGGNYALGHWLNGRTSAEALAAVVAEICARAGVTEIDVSRLFGLVRGYATDDLGGARSALQPLMLAFGFEAVERDGILKFQMRAGQAQLTVDADNLAFSTEISADVDSIRAPDAETVGRVKLGFVEADRDFETRSAEAVFPDDASVSVSQTELAISLSGAEGRAIAERWLSEARIARDSVRFALPPSAGRIGAGDVVTLSYEGTEGNYRIDRIENAGILIAEAVRVEHHVYTPSRAVDDLVPVRPFNVVTPATVQFLDLPLLTGDEVPSAPHIAVASSPWLGDMAIYQSASDVGYQFNSAVTVPSGIGTTLSALERAKAGLWDLGASLMVKIKGTHLSSASTLDVLNGANVVAIGDSSSANWEIFQFAKAELVAPDTYALTCLLRGQQGSDALMPDVWPEGSRLVVLDGRPEQIVVSAPARGLDRYYRIGLSSLGYDDPSYVQKVEAFDGIGLRPYAPCHLKATRCEAGDILVSWIRRTRIDGDSWLSVEVPVGEDKEQYVLRVYQDETLVREEAATEMSWFYSLSLQAEDGISRPFEIHVAQVSDRFGPGPFTRIDIND